MTQNNSVYNEIKYSPDYPLVIQKWQKGAPTTGHLLKIKAQLFFTRYLMMENPTSQLVQA
jgi:hypothetical protein